MSYILLSSAKSTRNLTRAYEEYESREAVAKKVVDYFEDYLLTTIPENVDLEYQSDELFAFIDEFFDELVCLERQANCPDLYTPYTTTWVKEIVYSYLRNQCPIQDDTKNGEYINGQLDQILMDTS